MKRESRAHRSRLYAVTAALLFLIAFSGSAYAQSSDPDQPTLMSSNVIEGEGDGQAAVYYYQFTANGGEVKITVDAKATPYSTLLDVELQDEDGKQFEKVGVVATAAGKREVMRHKFLRQMRAIIKVSMRDDKDVKSLVYKIKVEGDAAFTGSAQPSSAPSNEGTASAGDAARAANKVLDKFPF